MKNWLPVLIFPTLVMAFPVIADVADDRNQCKGQAEQILARLQTEVVGELNADQRSSANQIVLDVCQAREQQVEVQKEQAVQEARDEEQEKASSWLTESANKPGNKRLKRRGH